MAETEVDSETELKDIEDNLRVLAESDLAISDTAQKLLESMKK